jgi:1-acyl-sn-glycerol-3-phosphate acyltransferase
MRWIGGMQIEVRGREHMPKTGPALLAGKHHCEVDAVLLAADIPGIAFVAMHELFKAPVIGTILYRLQMIRVDTCGGGKEREHLAQYARRAYDGGRHIVIYPEGHLMAPGERERYRSGIYYLSRDLGLPVTPVATSVGLLWNRRDWRKKPGRAAIEFLPAIETGLHKHAFMRRLEDTIETASSRLIAEFTGRPYADSQLVLRSQGQTGIGQPITAPRATL